MSVRGSSSRASNLPRADGPPPVPGLAVTGSEGPRTNDVGAAERSANVRQDHGPSFGGVHPRSRCAKCGLLRRSLASNFAGAPCLQSSSRIASAVPARRYRKSSAVGASPGSYAQPPMGVQGLDEKQPGWWTVRRHPGQVPFGRVGCGEADQRTVNHSSGTLRECRRQGFSCTLDVATSHPRTPPLRVAARLRTHAGAARPRAPPDMDRPWTASRTGPWTTVAESGASLRRRRTRRPDSALAAALEQHRDHLSASSCSRAAGRS